MPSATLTKRTVDALEFQPGCNYFVWDTKLRGFGIHVTERTDRQGTVLRRKTFVLQYRPVGSRVAKRITIGAFGPLTPEEAREEARLRLSDTAKGIDPKRILRISLYESRLWKRPINPVIDAKK